MKCTNPWRWAVSWHPQREKSLCICQKQTGDSHSCALQSLRAVLISNYFYTLPPDRFNWEKILSRIFGFMINRYKIVVLSSTPNLRKENISAHFLKCLQTIVNEIQNIRTLDNHPPQIHSLWFNQLDNSFLSRAQGCIAYNMCLNLWFVYNFYYQINSTNLPNDLITKGIHFIQKEPHYSPLSWLQHRELCDPHPPCSCELQVKIGYC